jgi:hypothetical protein
MTLKIERLDSHNQPERMAFISVPDDQLKRMTLEQFVHDIRPTLITLLYQK